ncbi:MAG TPA: 3-phosphoshikimate 1-carboxyvinyltransferase [Flavisolibacter sp.]|jgi:3-phosphoshikimate 1-carboxyvinyltransferase|nr:3-phosphoshikimate 1-carboxyvinyltransferase [Flavisolibacter sp.]
MQAIVQPAKLSGTITAPTSKSAMQRACAAALLKGGKTVLHNPGVSDDDKAALDIIQQLGAKVEGKDDDIIITSNGVHAVSNEINCGESGLSVRMFTSIAALSDKEIMINGRGSLVKRPLSFFNEVLPQLDVQCESNNGLLPLKIKGPLQPKNNEVDGSLSSQFLTGLLFAYSAANASDVAIKVNNLNSKPYIDLTLKLMADFGLKTPENKNYEEFYFPKKSTAEFSHDNFNYTVEADWSGAAFLLVAGAISGNIIVKGLDVFSAQADKAILQALIQSETNISVTGDQIEIRESKLKAFHFNATDCPDLFPPLVALASYCEGTSVIEGVHRLTHKESNRALTLQEEFGKMGIKISFQDDLMLIKGGTGVKNAKVSSRHDHRIAMACAVAALKADGEVVINDAQAVNKSYPQFWAHLQKLNAAVTLNHN